MSPTISQTTSDELRAHVRLMERRIHRLRRKLGLKVEAEYPPVFAECEREEYERELAELQRALRNLRADLRGSGRSSLLAPAEHEDGDL